MEYRRRVRNQSYKGHAFDDYYRIMVFGNHLEDVIPNGVRLVVVAILMIVVMIVIVMRLIRNVVHGNNRMRLCK
jgi:hypothetical protein